MTTFYISIKFDRRPIRLRVERIAATNETELFRITARNKSFVLQSNRPLLQAKGLKYRKPNWKVIEGGYDKPFILEQIIKEIESKLQ